MWAKCGQTASSRTRPRNRRSPRSQCFQGIGGFSPPRGVVVRPQGLEPGYGPPEEVRKLENPRNYAPFGSLEIIWISYDLTRLWAKCGHAGKVLGLRVRACIAVLQRRVRLVDFCQQAIEDRD